MNSQFYYFPYFPTHRAELEAITRTRTQKAKPAEKYKILEDVLSWATNIGLPGLRQRGDRRNLPKVDHHRHVR